jgi:hypothetical protein
MASLYRRTYNLTLGTQDVTGLHIRFRVEKTLKAAPNTCSIDVHNLAPETREALEKAKKIPVRLEAGYNDENEQIYLGEVRTATSVTEGSTITTHVESGDGEKQIQSSRISVPVGPKTPADVALRAIARTLGVGLGNIDAAAARLRTSGKALFPMGRVITGNTAQQLTDFCNSAGLEWSIQDGKLQFLDKGKALDGNAFELSSDSGLIGSPSVDSKGVVTAQSLFIAGMRPGVKVVFASRSVHGGYRVQKCTYTGDFAGNDWFVEIEAKKY